MFTFTWICENVMSSLTLEIKTGGPVTLGLPCSYLKKKKTSSFSLDITFKIILILSWVSRSKFRDYYMQGSLVLVDHAGHKLLAKVSLGTFITVFFVIWTHTKLMSKHCDNTGRVSVSIYLGFFVSSKPWNGHFSARRQWSHCCAPLGEEGPAKRIWGQKTH